MLKPLPSYLQEVIKFAYETAKVVQSRGRDLVLMTPADVLALEMREVVDMQYLAELTDQIGEA